MQINTDKSKIMVFHEHSDDHANLIKGLAVRRGGVKTRLPTTPFFHIQRSFPSSLPADQRMTTLRRSRTLYTSACVWTLLSLRQWSSVKSNQKRASLMPSNQLFPTRFSMTSVGGILIQLTQLSVHLHLVSLH